MKYLRPEFVLKALPRRWSRRPPPLTTHFIYIWPESPLQRPELVPSSAVSEEINDPYGSLPLNIPKLPLGTSKNHLQAFRKLFSHKKQSMNRTHNLILQWVLDGKRKCNAARELWKNMHGAHLLLLAFCCHGDVLARFVGGGPAPLPICNKQSLHSAFKQSFYNRLNDIVIQNMGMRGSMQFQVYVNDLNWDSFFHTEKLQSNKSLKTSNHYISFG